MPLGLVVSLRWFSMTGEDAAEAVDNTSTTPLIRPGLDSASSDAWPDGWRRGRMG